MTDILIQGMEMPEGCSVCKLAQWDGETYVCPFCGDVFAFSDRHDNCPLHGLPPHGDLISRNEALSFPLANGKYDHENANEDFIFGCESYKEWLEQLPVVILANKEESE